MREEPKIRELGEVCVRTKTIKWENHVNDEFEYIDLSAVSREELCITSSILINYKNAPSRAKKIVETGDIIFATTRPTLRRVAIIPEEFDGQICSTGFVVLRPNVKKVISSYLFYALQLEGFYSEMEALQKGAAYPAVTDDNVKSFRIPVPPLAEQERIVAILDEAFAAIDQAKANIERNIINARELFQSRLNQIFTEKGDGWVEKRLGDFLTFLNGFAFKSNDTVETSNVQLVRMGNLYQNVLNLDRTPVYYPDSYASLYERYVLKEGDLILSLTGTTGKEDYGFTVKIPETDKILLLNQRISKITITNDSFVSKGILYFFLISRVFLDVLYESANGTRQANLSTETIKKFIFCFPSDIVTQKAIVAELEVLLVQTKHLEKTYQAKYEALDNLKQSLLEKAFSGELTAKEVTKTAAKVI